MRAFIVRLSPYDTIVLSMRRVGGQAGRQWPHRKVKRPEALSGNTRGSCRTGPPTQHDKHFQGSEVMSNDKTTDVVADTEAAEVTTLNSHATIEPVKIAPLPGDEATGTVKPNNSHATDEKA